DSRLKLTVSARGAGACLAGFEHYNGARIGPLQKVPSDGGPSNSATDDHGVGRGRQVGRGAVVGEGIRRVLPVADRRLVARKRDGDLGALIHGNGTFIILLFSFFLFLLLSFFSFLSLFQSV